MRLGTRITVWLLTITAVLTAAFSSSLSLHAEDTLQTVKVGYFNNGDFLTKNTDGTYYGYDVEYYYTLAQIGNWKIQFVDYDSLADAETALQNGEIDLLSGLSKTADRQAKFLFSAAKMCTTQTSIQVRTNDNRYSLSEPDTLADMNCGIVKGSVIISLYQQWCSTIGVQPHITLFDNASERDLALADQKIDAVAAGSTIEGAQKIAVFPAFDIYFVLNQSSTAFKKELDTTMSILSMENPSFSSDLMDKYFPSSRNTSPSFTKTETQFIADHPTIKVGLQNDNEPFSYGKTGNMKGYLPQYYAHLATLTGFQFELIGFDDEESMLSALKNHEIDVIGKSEKDAYSAEEKEVAQTNVYLSVNLVQMSRAGNTSIKSAAVPKFNERQVARSISETGANVDLTIYTNNKECMQALQDGKVDVVYFSSPTASYYLAHNRASDYLVTSISGDPLESCISMNMDQDGNTLRSIFNKTLAVDGSAFNQIVAEDLIKENANISNMFKQLPVTTIVSLALLFFAMMVFFMVALFIILRRRKTEKKLAVEQANLAAAAEANKARHAFFGAVSHDMRTPLNGIMGFTDLALKSDDPEIMRSYLKKIHTSGETLNLLVNDTLLMSRLENNKYILTPVPTDLAELLEGVLLPIQQSAHDKGVTFVDEATAVCQGWYNIDQISVQKVFINLLSNAIKFSRPGGTIRFHCIRKENAFTFTVIDEGIGIDEKFQAHMFEPFTQEDAANSKGAGSGLGLSIVKSIVDAMNGTIDVHSKKGEGTVFTIQLVLEPCEVPSAKTEHNGSSCRILAGRHALICEDNELNMEIEAAILIKAGMEVTKAADGKQGVDAFEKSEEGYYDIILMDLRMPVMDGLTAAKKIRAMKREDADTVLIYAVSADAFSENVAEAMDAGMDGHIAKPIHAELMVQTLAKAIDKGI